MTEYEAVVKADYTLAKIIGNYGTASPDDALVQALAIVRTRKRQLTQDVVKDASRHLRPA